MNVRINQAEKLKKEIRRKNWIKRVKKQRKRYLSRALKGSSMRKFTWQKQAFSEMLSFCLAGSAYAGGKLGAFFKNGDSFL